MFDINSGEMVLLAGIALVVLGPDKLPGYAAQAARMVRQLRLMADGAKDQMKEHLGPEFDDVDWKSLDPRQYDPRRIVRDALLDNGSDDSEDSAGSGGSGSSGSSQPTKPVSPGAPQPVDLPQDGAGQPADGSTPSAGAERAAMYDEDAT